MKNTLKKIALTFAVLQILIGMCACSTTNDTTDTSQGESVSTSESSAVSESRAESPQISSEADEDVKTITFTVAASEDDVREYTISTKADTLQEALEQENLIEGEESSYGLFVTTVDGVTADDSNQEWWCLTKDGEEWVNGVSTTDIADGDKYEFTLTTGY